MNWKESSPAFLEFLKNAGAWMRAIAKRHSLALIGSALVVVALMSLWSAYREWRTTEYILLVGPGGSTGGEDAKPIKSTIEKQSWIGATYRVRVEETGGSEDIRRLLNADQTGLLMGFGHDGFGNAENVRILLPMDWNYLHVICRRKFLDRLLSEEEKVALKGKVTFADLMKHRDKLRKGRFNVGQQGSGTRELAKLVLERYEMDADLYQTNVVSNGNDMRAALNNNMIDVAFFNGRMDSGTMKSIAADGNSVLIGLDGDRDAIIQGHWNLQVQTFKKNSYSSSSAGFCPEALQTFASRRVLLCSSRMSEPTAYFLAKHSQDALRPVVPEIDWVNTPPVVPRSKVLTYRVHPGADLLRNDKSPGPVPWNWNYVLMTLGLWGITEVVQYANRGFRARAAQDAAEALEGELAPPEEPAPTPDINVTVTDPAVAEATSRDAYDALEREIHHDLYLLVDQPDLSKSERTRWMRQVRQRRSRIEQMGREGRLLPKHADALLQAVDKLEGALARRQVKPRQDDSLKPNPPRSK